VRDWMEEWLRYVHWYYQVGLSPEVTLDSFFPVYTKSWKVQEPDQVRFGLKWQLWDKVQEMGLGWSLPALSPGSSNSICKNGLLGGEGDKQFGRTRARVFSI
jgi:hypothetical protein